MWTQMVPISRGVEIWRSKWMSPLLVNAIKKRIEKDGIATRNAGAKVSIVCDGE